MVDQHARPIVDPDPEVDDVSYGDEKTDKFVTCSKLPPSYYDDEGVGLGEDLTDDSEHQEDGGPVLPDHGELANNGLRPIVIDGSNIAMSHGNKQCFSCQGIQIVVDWFRQRGHRDITVFVPKWRCESHKNPDCPIIDQDVLRQLEGEKVVVFTPCRKVSGRRIICYDDRYIVKLAAENNGIIVSNDTYRDLAMEQLEFRKVIEERLLMYSFVNDRFMPPDDPMGRHGPSLDSFLKVEPKTTEPPAQPCPYPRCTYGAKCRYYHPERPGGYQRRPSRGNVSDGVTELQQRLSSSPGPDTSGHSSRGRQPLRRCGPRRSDPTSRQQPDTSISHLDLRHVHSDPCGHLEIAKKLSEEYKGASSSPSVRSLELSTASSMDSLISTGSNSSIHSTSASNEGSEAGRIHRQLERQLTFRDQEDPRLAKMNAAANGCAIQDFPVPNESQTHGSARRCATVPTGSSVHVQPHRTSSLDVHNNSGNIARGNSEILSSAAAFVNQKASSFAHPSNALDQSSTVRDPSPAFNDPQQWRFHPPVVGLDLYRESSPSGQHHSILSSPAGFDPRYFVPNFGYPPPPFQNASSLNPVQYPANQLAHVPHLPPQILAPAPTFGCSTVASAMVFRERFCAPFGTMPNSSYPASDYTVPGLPRHDTYVKLCAVFPEEKVRQVMDRYSLETDPPTLCKFLVDM